MIADRLDTATVSFHNDLITLLPQMRIWARGLARNPTAAEDLTQDTVVKALQSQSRFEVGTKLGAWVYRIMVNHFISGLRRHRHTDSLENAPEPQVSGAQQDKLALKQLAWAIDRLPHAQREALFLIVLQELSYEEAAEMTGCAIGTMKSRVHRTRSVLQQWLLGGERREAAEPVRRRGRPRNHPALALSSETRQSDGPNA